MATHHSHKIIASCDRAVRIKIAFQVQDNPLGVQFHRFVQATNSATFNSVVAEVNAGDCGADADCSGQCEGPFILDRIVTCNKSLERCALFDRFRQVGRPLVCDLAARHVEIFHGKALRDGLGQKPNAFIAHVIVCQLDSLQNRARLDGLSEIFGGPQAKGSRVEHNGINGLACSNCRRQVADLLGETAFADVTNLKGLDRGALFDGLRQLLQVIRGKTPFKELQRLDIQDDAGENGHQGLGSVAVPLPLQCTSFRVHDPLRHVEAKRPVPLNAEQLHPGEEIGQQVIVNFIEVDLQPRGQIQCSGELSLASSFRLQEAELLRPNLRLFLPLLKPLPKLLPLIQIWPFLVSRQCPGPGCRCSRVGPLRQLHLRVALGLGHRVSSDKA
mmetsp:Transcript_72637/g.166639  ORF Transcript_72637/g.166639 Transcript_72637/m.166639 type:complete len:387 (-) Transcript_72637:1386-2546(-)